MVSSMTHFGVNPFGIQNDRVTLIFLLSSCFQAAFSLLSDRGMNLPGGKLNQRHLKGIRNPVELSSELILLRIVFEGFHVDSRILPYYVKIYTPYTA